MQSCAHCWLIVYICFKACDQSAADCLHCVYQLWFRTLLRRLRDLNLQRLDHASPILAVWKAVQAELRGPGDCAV